MIRRVAPLGREVDLRATMLERLEAQRRSIALEITPLALFPLFDLGLMAFTRSASRRGINGWLMSSE